MAAMCGVQRGGGRVETEAECLTSGKRNRRC
jgi:hypothetical protein